MVLFKGYTKKSPQRTFLCQEPSIKKCIWINLGGLQPPWIRLWLPCPKGRLEVNRCSANVAERQGHRRFLPYCGLSHGYQDFRTPFGIQCLCCDLRDTKSSATNPTLLTVKSLNCIFL